MNETLVSRHQINKCVVDVIFTPSFGTLRLVVTNTYPIPQTVDFTKLRIEWNNASWYIPFVSYVDGDNTVHYQVSIDVLKKVDNLTLVEELAKERNLV